jgi:hypothetical protein
MVVRYWVDPLELTNVATHTEPYCGPNTEASIVVSAAAFDAVLAEIHQLAENGVFTTGANEALKKIRDLALGYASDASEKQP